MEFNNFKLEIVDKEICILSFNSQDTNINTVNKSAIIELSIFIASMSFLFTLFIIGELIS